MRMSLQISPKAKTSEAVFKFWATGKMLTKAYKLNKKKRQRMVRCTQILIDQLHLKHLFFQFG